MTTIKDVARQVGLSITTVSRALNNYDDVSAATRLRVQEAAHVLDYHPNAAARSLQGSQANAIGLVIPLTLHRSYDAFWLDFIGGVTAVCAQRGMDLLVSMADMHGEVGPSLQRLVRGRRIDGLIVCDIYQTDPRIEYLHRRRLPFVAFGRTTHEQNYPFIDVDGAAGVAQAVEHLLRLGHRRIAYMGLPTGYGFSHFRYQGYRASLARAGLRDDPALVYHDLTEDAVAPVLERLLALPAPPTALFAAGDFLGLAALKALRATGLSVPGDLSLAVFDDSLLIQHAEPPLTAVSQPNRRVGEEAAALLLDRVANPERPLIQRLVVPSLVVRASTAPPEAASRSASSALVG